MLTLKNKEKTKSWKFLKNFDIYAKPITMTYRGKEKFRSMFGGIISVIILMVIVFIFSYKMKEMVNRTKTQVKKNTLIKASNSYSPPENLMSKNITIAFMLSNYYGEGALDEPQYGKFSLLQKIVTMKENQTDGTTYRDFNVKPIPFSKCEIGKNFFYPDKVEIKDFQIENFYCPDTKELII